MGKLWKNTRGLTDFFHKTSLMYIVYCDIIRDTIWQVLSSGGYWCKLSHLHIHEYLWKLEKWKKNHWREKAGSNDWEFASCDSKPTLHPYDDDNWMPTTRNLEPAIVDLPYTPMTISTGCQIVHLDLKMQKYCPQNLTHLGYVKLNGFHDNQ